MNKFLLLVVVATLVLTACQPAAAPTEAPAAPANTQAPAAPADTQAPAAPAAAANPGLQMDSAKVATQFFTDADYQKSLEFMKMPALNPNDPIYLQYLESNPTNISKYPQYAAFAQKKPPYNICFSNAGVNNPWRVVGYVDIREQVEELRAQGLVKNFYHLDAQGNDAKQIADIGDIINTPGKCDVLIVASNTSEALTPIVEKACEVMPVVQFDRFAQTDCPVVSERTIGGYAFGISGAQFIVDNLPQGGNVLAFRILPGVDVLEQRWGAARKIFEQNPQLNIIGVEFVGYDSFKANTVVSDYLAKYGKIDAVWMDAGGTAVTILEAFKDAGAPYPKVMVGEDQEDYLQYWKLNNLTAIAPTFPTFQWRTAVLSAVMFLQGKDVQHHWTMPQPEVVTSNLDKYINTSMPPLHYALCGCEDMKNYPASWQNVDVNKYKDVVP
ncbi:MAG TPA: ABC transporter substrate-binding protein [Anaerolineales bacterium]|nr:ABC transporter substrate-binding protein [Anaerolineales bacterium]